jgi:hypothetical protein
MEAMKRMHVTSVLVLSLAFYSPRSSIISII